MFLPEDLAITDYPAATKCGRTHTGLTQLFSSQKINALHVFFIQGLSPVILVLGLGWRSLNVYQTFITLNVSHTTHLQIDGGVTEETKLVT